MSASVVGTNVARVEDPPLLRGSGRFVDDIDLPGMLHAAFVRSPHAHAAIRSIETTAAAALSGVHAILMSDDLKKILVKTRLVVGLPSPAYRQELHRPILAREEVVHVGEPIAAVIAESRYVAEDAAALVEVDFDPLPIAADCQQALSPGASPAHRNSSHNLVAEFTLNYGDVDAAFATANHIFRESLWQHRGGSHSIECRGSVAIHDPIEDRLTFWSSTQTPHVARRILCDVLGRDEDQVRVVVPDVGGGFGPKLVFYPEDVCVAVAALILDRPVKWIEDRREHFVATTQERDQYWDVEIAVDAAARILGVRGALIHDHGAYTARGVNVAYGSAAAMPLPYRVPAYRLDIKLAVTNKVPVTPVRGAGQPQGVFAMERLLDLVARKLEIDRAEVRRRNLVAADEMPYVTPLKTRGGMRVILDSGDYPRCQAETLKLAGWDGFRVRQLAARAEGRYIGIGLANYVEGTGRGPYEQVSVRIQPSGRVHVYTGAAPMGQSTKTMLAQIVAEQLGGEMDNITVIAGDTAAVPLGLGGFNSRQTVLAGTSAHVAAVAVRKKVFAIAAQLLETDEKDLNLDGREVRVRTGNAMSLPLAEIARAAAGLPGFPVPGRYGPGLAATEQVVIDNMTYANGTAVAEVEVDIETGGVKVTNFVFTHDCGRAIHPMIVDGQIMGGIAHGLGNALFEWMAFDSNAQPLTTNLAEYLLVSATEMPPIQIRHQESPTTLNPLGVKGVGESGVLPTPAAIISAIEDALSPFNVRIRKVPIMPADIVALLDSVGGW